MTVLVWPDDLPQYVLLDNFQAGPRGQRLSTAMDSGPAKLRRRGPPLRPLTVSIDVDNNQRARFDRFYHEEADSGTQPFLIRDMLDDERGLGDDQGEQLLDESGECLQIESWILVQFGQSDPVYGAHGGDEYQIQFEIVVLP